MRLGAVAHRQGRAELTQQKRNNRQLRPSTKARGRSVRRTIRGQDRLDAVLRKTTRTVKAALLDQKGVAGLGNIYIDEACFLAGVRPTQRCHRLTRKERAALLDAIRRVLTAAVANRGSSVDDYRDAWNARGSNQERLQVYGRGGEPCFTCGRPLNHTVTAGRTTVYCAKCQR